MRVNPGVEAAGTVRARLVRLQQLARHGVSAVHAPSSKHFKALSAAAGLVPAPVSSRLEGGQISYRRKGKSIGSAAVYGKQALVLVNCGGATGGEVLTLAKAIQESVYGRFGVRLEAEPVVV